MSKYIKYPSKLAVGMKLYMSAHNETSRDLAPRLNMSHATLSRFLQGHELEGKNLMAIINYMLSPIYPDSIKEDE